MFTCIKDIDYFVLIHFLERKDLHTIAQVSQYAHDMVQDQLMWIRKNEYIPMNALLDSLVLSSKRVYRINNKYCYYNDIDRISSKVGPTQEKYIKYNIKHKVSQFVVYSCSFLFKVVKDNDNVMSLYIKDTN
jgi:hypothetical protein